MTSERSKRRDFAALSFIKKSVPKKLLIKILKSDIYISDCTRIEQIAVGGRVAVAVAVAILVELILLMLGYGSCCSGFLVGVPPGISDTDSSVSLSRRATDKMSLHFQSCSADG